MKNNVWPLLIVALLALGTFSLIGLQGDSTGLAMKNRPELNPIVINPGTSTPAVESGLNLRMCSLAYELYDTKTIQGVKASSELEQLVGECLSRGY